MMKKTKNKKNSPSLGILFPLRNIDLFTNYVCSGRLKTRDLPTLLTIAKHDTSGSPKGYEDLAQQLNRSKKTIIKSVDRLNKTGIVKIVYPAKKGQRRTQNSALIKIKNNFISSLKKSSS